jgi:hypothetical protein
VAIFVDGGNMSRGGQRWDLEVDYGQVLKWTRRGGPARPDGGVCRGLGHQRDIVKATVYMGPSSSGKGLVLREAFIRAVESVGYDVHEACEEGDGNKTAVDRDIIIDALVGGLGGRFDVMVLLSGDGGFTRLVQILRSVGVRVEVCAFEDASGALRQAGDRFVDLGAQSMPGGPLTRVRKHEEREVAAIAGSSV